MKLVLFAILGLLLGVGGGAAMAVMKAKKEFAAYDAKRAKVVADSIEMAAHPPATTDSGHATPDSAHAPADSSPGKPAAMADKGTHAAPVKDSHAAPAHTTPAASADQHTPRPARQRAVATVEAHGGTRPAGKPAPPRPIAPARTAPSPGTDKVSRIFAAMPPKDAAKVLEQLSDTEVTEILRSLSEKQAAGIMQFLPPARAAAISKLALKGGDE